MTSSIYLSRHRIDLDRHLSQLPFHVLNHRLILMMRRKTINLNLFAPWFLVDDWRNVYLI